MFSYYCSVFVRSLEIVRSWSGGWGWRAVILSVAVFVAGLVLHHQAIIRWPALETWTGSPAGAALRYAMYGVAAVVLVTGILWLGALVYAPAVINSEQVARIAALTPANALELFFQPEAYSLGKDAIEFTGITVTNRSGRPMNLAFQGYLRYVEDGRSYMLRMAGELSPKELTRGSGRPTLQLGSGESSTESLVFLGASWLYKQPASPYEAGLSYDEAYARDMEAQTMARYSEVTEPGHIIIKVSDSVSGVSDCFLAMQGYPAGRVDSQETLRAERLSW